MSNDPERNSSEERKEESAISLPNDKVWVKLLEAKQIQYNDRLSVLKEKPTPSSYLPPEMQLKDWEHSTDNYKLLILSRLLSEEWVDVRIMDEEMLNTQKVLYN